MTKYLVSTFNDMAITDYVEAESFKEAREKYIQEVDDFAAIDTIFVVEADKVQVFKD